jgi:hypothetical protein
MRLQALTRASMEVTSFWDTVPCSLVEVYQRFGGSYCIHLQCNSSDDGGSTGL